MRSRWITCFAALTWAFCAGLLNAQSLDSEDLAEAEDNGYFISLLEDQLSTESRKIRLSGVGGLLSSRATVERITISDAEGVWFQIDNATLDWNRRGLLTGSVVVNELRAERIRIPRGPIPEEGLPEAEASGGFSIPDLPVSVSLKLLEAERIEIGEALFGIEAALKTSASIELDDGELDATLEMERLDGPGGALSLMAKVEGDPVNVNVNLDFNEPQGGLIAGALGLDGQPPMEVLLEVAGPVTDLNGILDLKIDGQDLLDGSLTVAQYSQGLSADLSLTGRLQPLVPASLRPFFEGDSTVDVTARQLSDGGMTLDRLAVRTGGVRLNGSLTTAPDGFPEALDLTGTLGSQDGNPLILPSGDQQTSVSDGELQITYGRDASWTGQITLNALQSGDFEIDAITMDMGGAAENLSDAATRRLSGKIEGAATGFESGDAGIDAALGDAVTLGVEFDWRAGTPLQLALAEVQGANSSVGLTGAVDGSEFTGTATLAVPQMEVLAPLVGRDLAGALDVSLDGSVDPVTGVFDLGVAGQGIGLDVGVAAIAALLEGETVLAGRLRRSTDGLFADAFSLRNEQLDLTADGGYSVAATDFDFNARLSDIALVTPEGEGAVTLTGRAQGSDGSLGLTVAARMAEGQLLDRAVTGLELSVTAEGQSASDLGGQLGASGNLGDAAVSLSGAFALDGDIQSLRELDLKLGQTAVTGTLKRGADGLIAGNLGISSPDISEPAALALTEAQGAAEVTALLFRSAGRQMLSLDAAITDLDVAGTTLATAQADMTVSDLFGEIPLVDGTVTARDAVVANYAVTTMDLAAVTEGEAMRVDASAGLGNGADIALAGLLTQLGGGDLAVDLNDLDLSYAGEDVTLRAPARVEVRGSTVSLTPLRMGIAGGELSASGTIGEELDLALNIQSVPLDVADAVVPQAGLGGVISASANLTGPPTAPQGSFSLQAQGLTAAQAVELGLQPADIDAEGQLNGTSADVTADLQLGTQAAMMLDGTIPFSPEATGLDLRIGLERLALSMLDTLAGNQGLGGMIAGEVTLTGAMLDPAGQLSLRATDVTATALREAGIGTLALDLEAAVVDQQAQVDGTVQLSEGGEVSVRGTVPFDPDADNLSLDLSLADLPIAIADQLAGGQGLGGTLNGSGTATGRLSDPTAQMNLRATGVTATALKDAGVGTLTLDLAATVADQLAQLDGAVGLSEGGQVTVKGALPFDPDADGLTLDLAIVDVPIAVADQLAGNQGLAGTLNGTAKATGRLSDPNAQVTLRATDVSANPLRAAGVGTLGMDLDATLAGQRAQVDGVVLLSQGGQLTVAGTLPLDPSANDLSIDLALSNLPLAIVDQLAGGQGLSGTLTANATASGALTNPSVVFDINGRSLSASALREAGVSGLDLTANGQFADNTVTLSSADVVGPSGLRVSAAGAVPLAGPGLDIRVDGTVPLELSAVALARSQSQLLGTLTLNGSASGALTSPDLSGTLAIAGGTFVNAPANVRLNDINVAASISGTRLSITSARATSAQGGTISVSGGVDIDTAAGVPMDLDVALDQLLYTDGQVVTTVASGTLSIDGPVLGNGLVSGRIALERTEVSLRGGFGISAGVLLDVQHRNPPRDVVLTLDRARVDELREDAEDDGGGSSLGLDVVIAVPNKLFIRGRGVDAELGGQIRISGTTSNVQPVGNIELLRGRLNLLGQRIDFDEGEVTLIGDLDPRIRLVAETEASDGTAIKVTVSGPATDPTVELSSTPELPEDEVLAQLIYGRDISELSAFQIAQLAAAVATLSGGGEGAVGGFRSALGLADLDITTGDDGDVGVRAGAYISDNIYLDFEADSAGDTEGTVNIDFSRYLTGKVSVDNRGESSIGVFFETDY